MIKRGDMILIPTADKSVKIGMVSDVFPDTVIVNYQDEKTTPVLLFPTEVEEYKENYDYFLEESLKVMKMCDETGRQIYV